jgi:hypothetical protein
MVRLFSCLGSGPLFMLKASSKMAAVTLSPEHVLAVTRSQGRRRARHLATARRP